MATTLHITECPEFRTLLFGGGVLTGKMVTSRFEFARSRASRSKVMRKSIFLMYIGGDRSDGEDAPVYTFIAYCFGDLMDNDQSERYYLVGHVDISSCTGACTMMTEIEFLALPNLPRILFPIRCKHIRDQARTRAK